MYIKLSDFFEEAVKNATEEEKKALYEVSSENSRGLAVKEVLKKEAPSKELEPLTYRGGKAIAKGNLKEASEILLKEENTVFFVKLMSELSSELYLSNDPVTRTQMEASVQLQLIKNRPKQLSSKDILTNVCSLFGKAADLYLKKLDTKEENPDSKPLTAKDKASRRNKAVITKGAVDLLRANQRNPLPVTKKLDVETEEEKQEPEENKEPSEEEKKEEVISEKANKRIERLEKKNAELTEKNQELTKKVRSLTASLREEKKQEKEREKELIAVDELPEDLKKRLKEASTSKAQARILLDELLKNSKSKLSAGKYGELQETALSLYLAVTLVKEEEKQNG